MNKKTPQFKQPAVYDPTPLIDEVLEREGGFVNHALDRGGPTNYGISWRYNKDLFVKLGYSRDTVKLLTEEHAREIYRQRYYFEPKIHLLPTIIQELVFDFYINSGDDAIKQLQFLVGANPDGFIGQKTISAISKYLENNGVVATKSRYLDLREKFFHDIVNNDPTQQVFLKGWLNRVDKLRKT